MWWTWMPFHILDIMVCTRYCWQFGVQKQLIELYNTAEKTQINEIVGSKINKPFQESRPVLFFPFIFFFTSIWFLISDPDWVEFTWSCKCRKCYKNYVIFMSECGSLFIHWPHKSELLSRFKIAYYKWTNMRRKKNALNEFIIFPFFSENSIKTRNTWNMHRNFFFFLFKVRTQPEAAATGKPYLRKQLKYKLILIHSLCAIGKI